MSIVYTPFRNERNLNILIAPIAIQNDKQL